jgi:hypothetical protein
LRSWCRWQHPLQEELLYAPGLIKEADSSADGSGAQGGNSWILKEIRKSLHKLAASWKGEIEAAKASEINMYNNPITMFNPEGKELSLEQRRSSFMR